MDTSFFKQMLKLLLAVCLIFTVNRSAAQCPASFSFSYGANGLVTFSSTSQNTGVATIYTWQYGNSSTVSFTGSAGIGTSSTYSVNGSYTITLFVNNTATSCTSTATQVISVFNFSPSCSAIVSYMPDSTFSCNGSATVIGVNICSPTSYSWSNGATGNTVSGLCANTIYTAYISSPSSGGNCCSAISQTFIVCSLVANFVSAATATVGIISFSNTSVGTTGASTYLYSFGNGTSAFAPPSGSLNRQYTLSGVYAPTLTVNNAPTCISKSTKTISVILGTPVTCSLLPNFTQTVNSSGLVTFISSSQGTINSYFWDFGNGVFGSGISTSNTYTANGIYNVKLRIANTLVANCRDSITKIVAVNVPVTCSLSPNFTHTVLSSGLVNLNSSSQGTINSYTWDFGDGVYGSGITTSHNYIANGAYNIELKIKNTLVANCRDSIVYSVNVTDAACVANSNFNLSPTQTPLYWTATPSYPWNLTAVLWNWGDGASSNILYTSHTYSAAGVYSICLSASVSCGASAITCTSGALFKTNAEEMGLAYINVTKPSLVNGILLNEASKIEWVVYPNPNNGEFNISLKGVNASMYLCIYNAIGELIYETKPEIVAGDYNKSINLNDVSKGVYFIKVNVGYEFFGKKIIVNGQ